VLSAANQHSLLNLHYPQRIHDSQPKLSCLQQSAFAAEKGVVCSELAFAAEIMLFASNQRLLLKLSCLQRSLPKGVLSVANL
jgi:hypothetical protein